MYLEKPDVHELIILEDYERRKDDFLGKHIGVKKAHKIATSVINPFTHKLYTDTMSEAEEKKMSEAVENKFDPLHKLMKLP